MKYSILLPCWNQLEYTARCIDSIRRNSPAEEYRIVAVDNGSSDATRSYLRRNLRPETDILIENEENRGWLQAINQAAQAVDSDYLIFLNNDTIVTPGWLPDMAAHFRLGVAAVGPRSNLVMGPQNTNYPKPPKEANFLIGFCLMVDRAAWHTVGGFDERFGLGGSEEMDWAIRARMAGYRLLIARNVFIHHACSKSLAVLPECGPLGSEGYNRYVAEKDRVLREKWGDALVDQMLGVARPRKIAIGIPTRDSRVHYEFAIALAMMSKAGAWTEIIDCTRQLVHDARNMIVSYALEQGHDYLLWLDDDMVPPHDLLPRLLSRDKMIVGALAYGRKPPYLPCQYRHAPQAGLPWSYQPIEGHHEGLWERDGIGLSACLVKMEVFRQIPGPWHRLDDLGEDLHFCRLVRQYGYRVYCDTDIVVPHLGDEVVVTEETREQWEREQKKPEKTYLLDNPK